jgi:hypothetical protein
MKLYFATPRSEPQAVPGSDVTPTAAARPAGEKTVVSACFQFGSRGTLGMLYS